MDRLAEIKARHDAATQGPWQWFGNTKVHNLYLATKHGGRRFVMQFVRWGMGSAQPRFQRNFPGETFGVMTKATEFVKYEVPYRKDVSGIDHPDAIFIERAWEDVRDLLVAVDELKYELKQSRLGLSLSCEAPCGDCEACAASVEHYAANSILSEPVTGDEEVPDV